MLFTPDVNSDTTCHEILEHLASWGFVPHEYQAHYALFLPLAGRLSAEKSMDELHVRSLSHLYLRLILPGGKGVFISEQACDGQ